MADKPAQDRTETATPKRRSEAREKGNVAKSQELNSVAVLIAGIIALQFTSGNLFDQLTRFMTATYRGISFTTISPATLPVQVSSLANYFIPVIGTILILLLIVGIGINYIQVGPLFSVKALSPKFDKLNPLKGLKKIFSLSSLVELAKSIFKFVIVGSVCYWVLKKHIADFWILANVPIGQTFIFIAKTLFELAIKVCLALIVLAIADFAYQKWRYEKSLKMSKQEVKDEVKQQEGNPEIKGRIRSIQKQLSRKRMMAAIPDATVVVTNPTFIAVALKYEPIEKSDAPVLVAKGQRKIAEKIREIAQHHNVPIVENKSLARTLFDTTEVGMEIPVILYQAIAEILAQVYQMNQKQNPLAKSYSYA